MSGLLHDLRLLAYLRMRHARTSFVRLMYLTYSDFAADRSRGDRLYQVYIIAILVLWAAIMWAALLDGATAAFAVAGPQAAGMLLLGALLAFVAAFVVLGFQALRSSPVKLTRPDIAFVAGSPLDMRAVVFERFCASALGGGVLAAVLGYVAGACMGAGLYGVVDPLPTAFFALLLACGVQGGAWMLGIVRLSLPRGRRRRQAVAILVLVGLAAVAAGAVLALTSSPSGLFGDGFPLACAGAAMLAVAEMAVLVALAPRIDRTDVIQDSALYADLQPFGMLSPLDRATIDDYRRRRKLAMRPPRFRLPPAQGRGAVIARAFLSMVRQYEGLLSIVVQGAALAPLGVLALSGAGGLVLYLFWLAATLLFAQGVRRATQAFRDDLRVSLVRDRLPFGTLELLVLDALPAFAVMCVVSCVFVVCALPAGFPVAAGLGLAVLLNAGLVLSCGLDAVRLFPGGPRLNYEIGALALVAVTALFSFAGLPLLTVASSLAVCAAIAFVVQSGIECAR